MSRKLSQLPQARKKELFLEGLRASGEIKKAAEYAQIGGVPYTTGKRLTKTLGQNLNPLKRTRQLR